MKNFLYTLALLLSMSMVISCSDDDAPLPEDYTNVGVDTESINSTIMGQWKRYTITRITYSNEKESKQIMANYTGNFLFDDPGSSWNDFIVYNFPYNGTFEVRRYGERMNFYDRNNQRHTNLMLDQVSATQVVFKESAVYGDDYFVVTTHTLTKQ